MRFDELFIETVTKVEADKVRRNTHDDFGLGPDFVFIGGSHTPGEWTLLYGRLTDAVRDEFTPRMCEGRITSCRLIRQRGGDEVRAFASDRTGIPSAKVGVITHIPDDLVIFAR